MTHAGQARSESALALAIRGDREALSRIWAEHRRWVAAILLAHMPREMDVEDLLQDVAMTLLTKISTVRDEAAFKPWLRTIAVNAARTAGRRKETRAALARVIPFRRPSPESPSADQTVAADDQGRRLLDRARDLPEGYREPLLLRCVRGMSYKQIAAITGLEETTIETRIARARRMLRDDNAAADTDDRAASRTKGELP